MKLSLREKQSFYHELEQFSRSGIPMPQAVEALLPDSPAGGVRWALKQLQRFFREAETVPGAFARLQPAVGEMEATMIASSNDSGRLDVALAYLSNYFGTLHEVRSLLIQQLAWPVIQLHLGVLIMNATTIVNAGVRPYLLQCGSTFAVIYAIGLALYGIGSALMHLGQASSAMDRLLRKLPVVGALRRNTALGRFCATYEMQLQAGINVTTSLKSAAKASHSAWLIFEVERALPNILSGAQVARSLGGAVSLPASFRRVLQVGEDTGSLDEDLRRWADYYQKAAVRNLRTATLFLRWIVYTSIAAFLIYRIFAEFEQQVLDPIRAVTE